MYLYRTIVPTVPERNTQTYRSSTAAASGEIQCSSNTNNNDENLTSLANILVLPRSQQEQLEQLRKQERTMSVKEDLVGGVETAGAETEDANAEKKPAEGNAEEEPTTDVEGKNEDLLTVAKDGGGKVSFEF